MKEDEKDADPKKDDDPKPAASGFLNLVQDEAVGSEVEAGEASQQVTGEEVLW